MAENVLLICTIGGSSAPIAASLHYWKPARTIFLPSPQTTKEIQEDILPAYESLSGQALQPGNWETHELLDAQDMTRCLAQVRELRPRIQQWLGMGEDYKVVVDFTGGTKCMTASLALQASRWQCEFSYVGGKHRDKDGVGVVVSGSEVVMQANNPWEALGYQVMEEALPFFNSGAYAEAESLFIRLRNRIGDERVKRELSTLILLCQAYDLWDRFEHGDAYKRILSVIKNINDLRPVINTSVQGLQLQLERHLDFLAPLQRKNGPCQEHVLDLLANAKRRAEGCRYDDAVARIYRCVETLAQLQLSEVHDVSSSAEVPLEKVPEPLHPKWSVRAEEGCLRLGLQDVYALLLAKDDPLGKRFAELGWNVMDRSPLSSRNNSILAHGFEPVGKKVWEVLWKGALQLSGVNTEDLPEFITLSI